MKYKTYIARKDGRTNRIQSLKKHCLSVADLTAYQLKDVNLQAVGRIAGLLHDAGKYSNDAQQYLRDVAMGKEVERGSVNHTFAGARCAIERWYTAPPNGRMPTMDEIARSAAVEIIAIAIASHHGSIDMIGENGELMLKHILEKKVPGQKTALKRFNDEVIKQKGTKQKPIDLDKLFEEAVKEVRAFMPDVKQTTKQDVQELFFHLGLLSRCVNSALINADRLDTQAFTEKVNPKTLIRVKKPFDQAMHDEVLEKLRKQYPMTNKVIEARRFLSEMCDRTAGELHENDNLLRLDLPTGAGKTLTGLVAALNIAAKRGRKRIFFVAPLLAILQMSAPALRDILGDGVEVVEHHSNVLKDNFSREELRNQEMMESNWDAPVVVTTLVQFLFTLFKERPSCVRRMQSLTNSVIIIDEVQSVPVHMQSLFRVAINFLTEEMNATVILSSATHPYEKNTEHPYSVRPKQLMFGTTLMEDVFRRSKIVFESEACKMDKVYKRMAEEMQHEQSLLLVCNMRKEAAKFFTDYPIQGAKMFHVSGSMCGEHRIDTIHQMQAALARGEKVVCYATQTMNAGVDMSFACGFRLMAGLDDAKQAEGRINRNGESPEVKKLFICPMRGEWELTSCEGLWDIQKAKNACMDTVKAYEREPKKFRYLGSPESIDHYYDRLYRQYPTGAQNYPIDENGNTLFDLLSVNSMQSGYDAKGEFLFHQAFKTSGELFSVFGEDGFPVIVPYGYGVQVINKIIRALNNGAAVSRLQKLREEAGPYIVNAFDGQVAKLDEAGALIHLTVGKDTLLVLKPEFYDKNLGLVVPKVK